MTRLTLVLSLVALSTTALGDGLTLNALRARLKRADAGWSASENSVTRLGAEERRYLLGAQLPEGFQDYFESRVKSDRPALRGELDWRNKDGVNYASPILNQGRCGSCVAFAAIATLETQLNITRNTPSSPWALSPQHLFSCGGGGCGSGWQPGQAANFLKSQGVPDETCFPYASGAMGEDIACSKTCSDASSRALKIPGHSQPTFFFASVDAVKQALQKGPLMTTMVVYEDFFYYKSGVYKHTTGAAQGGHAVGIVGYSDADKAWIVRNSWGEDWGDKGYVKVAWDDTSGIGRQTWLLQGAGSDGFVTLGSLRDREVLRGTVTLKPESTFQGTHAIQIRLDKARQRITSAFVANEASYLLDTTQYADGVYVMTASAQHGGGIAQSQPRTVYLLNGDLTGGLRFTNVTAGQTLTGSYVFEMSVQSAPVPFTKVIFRARHVGSGTTYVRSTPNVASKMAFNWRLKDAASGDYDVWLEGQAGSAASITSEPVRVRIANR